MRLLKVFAVILCIVLVWWGLIALVNYIETYKPPQKEPVYTAQPPVADEDLTYAMAPIHKKLISEDGVNKTQLWFVIEFLEPRYQFVTDTLPYVVVDKNLNADLQSRLFVGNVCIDDHMSVNSEYEQWYDHDCRQYTICVTTDYDIDFDDIEVVASVQYVTPKGPDVYEKYTFEFNAELSEITTIQNFIHGNTLFELDGKYYVGDRFGSVDFEYDCGDACVHNRMVLVPITGSMDDLVSDLSKHDSVLVYGFGDESYLSDVSLPDDCELFFDTANGCLITGYRMVGSGVMSDDMRLDLQQWLSSIVIRCNCEDGFSMYIFDY